MTHRRMLLITALTLVVAGCSAPVRTQSEVGRSSENLRLLEQMMTGTFDSVDQSVAQPDDFFQIRLVMLPIWTERTDGPWLYVEQAAMSALDRPYRQRVYRLSEGPSGSLLSEVYTIPGDPLDHAGTWASGALLAEVDPADLELREGCAIHLVRSGDEFVGSTKGQGCTSTLRGASYATSEVEIGSTALVSWDRGWDSESAQAWGATAGGYRFVKRSGSAPAP